MTSPDSAVCPRCGSRIHHGAAFGSCPACLVSTGFGLRESDPPDDAQPAPGDGGDLPFDKLGAYRLIAKLGEGAYGEVYSAKQEKPVEREVAIKLLKRGMDSVQVVARFEAEQQALALMQHPNVGTVHEAGISEDGRPYFVMDLVDGRPITEFCSAHKVGLRQRLELFVAVCAGVQHAHGRGIIHRDLKPQNVLVDEREGSNTPKVIDFGIAKATDRLLTNRTLYTELGRLVGTPAYMSPEQAISEGADVDVRTDVYSLGVILYELLSGTPPFDEQRLRHAGAAEIGRILKEEQPCRPSTRLTQAQSPGLTPAAPAVIAKRVSGDLDWIVMRALEKERERRYPSAAALAADIGNFLRGDVVEARPPSVAYRLRKWMRRHRVALTAAAAVFLALLTGTVVAISQAIRAVRAERAAEERAQFTGALNTYIKDDLIAAVLEEGSLDWDKLEEILAGAEEKIEGRLTGYPLAEASARLLMARAFLGASQSEEAERNARRAHELFGQHVEQPDDFRYLGSVQTLARTLIFRDRPREAVELIDQMFSELGAGLDLGDRHVANLVKTKLVAMQESEASPAELLPIQSQLMATRYPEYSAWDAILDSCRWSAQRMLDSGEIDEAASFLRKASIVARLLSWSGTWTYRHNMTYPLRTAILKAGARQEQTATPWELRLSEWDLDGVVAEFGLPQPASTMLSAFLHSEAGHREAAARLWAEVCGDGAPDPEAHGLIHALALSLEDSGDIQAAERAVKRAIDLAHAREEELEIQLYAATWARLRSRAQVALPTDLLPVSTPRLFPGNGHRYALIEIPLPWHEAAEACEALGGHLATATDVNENRFLYETFATTRMCWLGASDHESEGEWRWITGEPWSFESWDDRQPSGTDEGVEDEDFAMFGFFDYSDRGVRWTWSPRTKWLDHSRHGIITDSMVNNRHANLLMGFAICEWDD